MVYRITILLSTTLRTMPPRRASLTLSLLLAFQLVERQAGFLHMPPFLRLQLALELPRDLVRWIPITQHIAFFDSIGLPEDLKLAFLLNLLSNVFPTDANTAGPRVWGQIRFSELFCLYLFLLQELQILSSNICSLN